MLMMQDGLQIQYSIIVNRHVGSDPRRSKTIKNNTQCTNDFLSDFKVSTEKTAGYETKIKLAKVSKNINDCKVRLNSNRHIIVYQRKFPNPETNVVR